MKISCRIIEDLLPLYHDNVCSKESSLMVEEHLKGCDSCRKMLEEIDKDTAAVGVPADDVSELKSLSRRWNKDKKRSLIKGAVIAAASCAVLFAGYKVLTQYKCIPVSTDVLEVSDVSRLKNGTIIYHLDIKDNKEIHWERFTVDKDGSYYLTPMRSVIEKRRTDDHGLGNDYFMVDIAENNAYQKKHGDGTVITSCYIGTKDDAILIWKEGMEIPQAGTELENLIK